MSAMLTTRQLVCGYSGKAVCGPFDLAIRPSKLICLLGENGSGKSTLIQCLCSLLSPISGEVEINGKPLKKMNREDISKSVTYIHAGRTFLPHTRVREMIALGRVPHTGWSGRLDNQDRDEIEKSMSMTGVIKFAEREIDELSDGEFQKCALARAITQDCPLMILDEPTAFLDPPSRFEIYESLKQVTRQGKSVLIATHDVELSLHNADELWLLHHDGKLLHGPSDLLKKELGTLFANRNLFYDAREGWTRD